MVSLVLYFVHFIFISLPFFCFLQLSSFFFLFTVHFTLTCFNCLLLAYPRIHLNVIASTTDPSTCLIHWSTCLSIVSKNFQVIYFPKSFALKIICSSSITPYANQQNSGPFSNPFFNFFVC